MLLHGHLHDGDVVRLLGLMLGLIKLVFFGSEVKILSVFTQMNNVIHPVASSLHT